MSENELYSVKQWQEALAEAEACDFDQVDADESGIPLAGWIAGEYTSDTFKSDSEFLDAAVKVIDEALGGYPTWSKEFFVKVLKSWEGETVDDFRELAEEFARETGTPLIIESEGPVTDQDYEEWYAKHAIRDGEVCNTGSAGGTLFWFDSNQW